MGAFIGACLLAEAGYYYQLLITPRQVAEALGASATFAIFGAVIGLGGALWLVLHNGSHWAGRGVAALTGTAIMVVVCLGYVAFA